MLHLVLHLLPLFAVAALLLGGRFVGEQRILARHRARMTPRVRREASYRWAPARPARFASPLGRSPRTFRGPPAPAAV